MTSLQLFLAMTLLLSTPGPSNTLLLLGAMRTDMRGMIWLLAAALAGYLVVCLLMNALGQQLFLWLPAARQGLGLASAAWVIWLGVKLWRAPKQQSRSTITAAAIGVTTLLNPKGLVIGLVMLPQTDAISGAMMICGAVALSGGLWLALGWVMAQKGQGAAPSVGHLSKPDLSVTAAVSAQPDRSSQPAPALKCGLSPASDLSDTYDPSKTPHPALTFDLSSAPQLSNTSALSPRSHLSPKPERSTPGLSPILRRISAVWLWLLAAVLLAKI